VSFRVARRSHLARNKLKIQHFTSTTVQACPWASRFAVGYGGGVR